MARSAVAHSLFLIELPSRPAACPHRFRDAAQRLRRTRITLWNASDEHGLSAPGFSVAAITEDRFPRRIAESDIRFRYARTVPDRSWLALDLDHAWRVIVRSKSSGASFIVPVPDTLIERVERIVHHEVQASAVLLARQQVQAWPFTCRCRFMKRRSSSDQLVNFARFFPEACVVLHVSRSGRLDEASLRATLKSQRCENYLITLHMSARVGAASSARIFRTLRSSGRSAMHRTSAFMRPTTCSWRRAWPTILRGTGAAIT